MSSSTTYAQQLLINGVVVVPFLEPNEQSTFHDNLIKEYKNAPEFIDGNVTVTNGAVMGGCQFGSFPSSFHNDTVRHLRTKAAERVIPLLFKPILDRDSDIKVAILGDRACVRPAGIKPTKESWHRDENKYANAHHTIFGGWVNLNAFDQHFSCCPKTHNEVAGNNGFALIESKEDKKKYKAMKEKIVIPAGHIIVFYERIVHEVLAHMKKEAMVRLFLGWDLTTDDMNLYGHYLNSIGPVVTPEEANKKFKESMKTFPVLDKTIGGKCDKCAMYSPNHLMFWLPRLLKFSENVRPAYCEDYTFKTGKNSGKTFRIVKRFMKAVEGEAWKAARPYSEKELGLFIPKRVHDTSRSEKRMASSKTGSWEEEAVVPAEPVYLGRSYGRVPMVGLDNGWSKHQVIGPASKVQRYDRETAETYGVPYRSITVGNFTWYHQRSHRDKQFHGYTFPNRRWGKRRRGEDAVVWHISESAEQSHRRHVRTINGNHSEELDTNDFSV